MKLMVLDGNSLINRAFYGVKPLTASDGTPTNAVYGFLNILFKLLADESPDALCVAFDMKALTFRHEQYEGYKAQRKGMPDELAAQMPILKEVLDAMHIARCERAGWEADDLLGTMAARAGEAGWETVVVTGDRDSLQLITDRVRVKLVSTRMGQTTTREMTPESFYDEYGFEPRRLIDLKALMGDASDNIPGVPGIGEKTALDLVRRGGTLEQIYQNLDTLELKPAVRRKLTEGRDMAFLSYDLATIRCNAPLDFQPQDALMQKPDEPRLYALFVRLEFQKLIDKMGLSAQGTQAAQRPDCPMSMVTDAGEAGKLLDRLRGGQPCVVLALPDLAGVAAACDGQCFVALRDSLAGYDDFVQALFASDIPKTTHDWKGLYAQLLREGIDGQGVVFDTCLAAYLLDPNAGSYALERLALSELGYELPQSAKFSAPDALLPLSDRQAALEALCAHTSAVLALADRQRPRLEELGMTPLLLEIELPLSPVLARMEREGMALDRGQLEAFGRMLTARIGELEQEIHGYAGEPFNIGSTKQLGVILFEKLGLRVIKKTKTGYSTDAEVLEKLRGSHPIIDCILEYRTLTKLTSTYVDGLLKVLGPDGKVHTTFQQTVTNTGRLSSTDPNLQNIPVRSELGGQVRRCFVPREGWVYVDADYSQIELRILAHIANDAHMLAAFESGEDIHAVTASQVFGVPLSEVTSLMRRRAKAVNFGIVYGISAFSLADDIGVTRAEAQQYIDAYLQSYSGVRDYMESIRKKAHEDGYVATLYGRRRPLPELRSSNFNLRSFGERVALNMPIQGTAADIMKIAMIAVDARLRREKLRARLVLQVHDELMVEAPADEREAVQRILEEEMAGAASLRVQLPAEASWGDNWYDAKH